MECSRQEKRQSWTKAVCYSWKTLEFVELPQIPQGSGGAFWKGTQEINGPINLEKGEMFLFHYEMGWNFHSEGAIPGIPIKAVWQSWSFQLGMSPELCWPENLSFSWAHFHLGRISQLFQTVQNFFGYVRGMPCLNHLLKSLSYSFKCVF